MARCPRCRRSFRTLEDEDGQHDCPYCGSAPGERRCDDCDQWFVPVTKGQTMCLVCRPEQSWGGVGVQAPAEKEQA